MVFAVDWWGWIGAVGPTLVGLAGLGLALYTIGANNAAARQRELEAVNARARGRVPGGGVGDGHCVSLVCCST